MVPCQRCFLGQMGETCIIYGTILHCSLTCLLRATTNLPGTGYTVTHTRTHTHKGVLVNTAVSLGFFLHAVLSINTTAVVVDWFFLGSGEMSFPGGGVETLRSGPLFYVRCNSTSPVSPIPPTYQVHRLTHLLLILVKGSLSKHQGNNMKNTNITYFSHIPTAHVHRSRRRLLSLVTSYFTEK